MEQLIESLTPYLAFTAALAAAVTAVGILWRRVLGPTLDATLLRGIHDRVDEVMDSNRRIESRMDQEFANGVPPSDERYVPLRHYLEAHVQESAAWRDKHEREHAQIG